MTKQKPDHSNPASALANKEAAPSHGKLSSKVTKTGRKGDGELSEEELEAASGGSWNMGALHSNGLSGNGGG